MLCQYLKRVNETIQVITALGLTSVPVKIMERLLQDLTNQELERENN